MRIVAWAVGLIGGLIFALYTVALTAGVLLVAGEDICLDRWPWWGRPNDPNVYTSCSGHMWERHEAGYGWFGGPK
jgi:hypothetical protein